MKTGLTVCMMISLVLAVSCGGGSSTPAPSPTSNETKVATTTAINGTIDAAGTAIGNAIQQAGDLSPIKAVVTRAINYTENCTDAQGQISGSFTVTGTATSNCEGTDAAWSCTELSAPVEVAFDNCAKVTTFSGVSYNEVLNGTTTTTATGTISGDVTGPTSFDVSGQLAGTVILTGDVEGNADLSEVTYNASGAPQNTTLACDGTASVTITGESAQTCTVAEDCNGCQA